MFTIYPIRWYDPDRISQDDIMHLMAQEPHVSFIAVSGGEPRPPMGEVMPERYPTPDELFRWSPK